MQASGRNKGLNGSVGIESKRPDQDAIRLSATVPRHPPEPGTGSRQEALLSEETGCYVERCNTSAYGAQRPESTGLMASIAEASGSHLRFGSSDDEDGAGSADCPLEDSEVIAQLQFEQDAAGRPVIILASQGGRNGHIDFGGAESGTGRENNSDANASRGEEQARLQKKW